MPHGGWVATFEDITEQRKLEQERERHGEFLNQIIDNVPVMIVVKDAASGSLFTPIAPPRRFGDFPARKPSARLCASCSRNGNVDVIDNADVEALKSGDAVVREAHPSMVHFGRSSAW